MPHTIAVAGKGGVGKTTICGMLVDYLVSQRGRVEEFEKNRTE